MIMLFTLLFFIIYIYYNNNIKFINDCCLQVEGSVSGRQPLGHESVVVDCSHSPASSSSSLGKQQQLQQQQQHHQQQQQSYVRTSAIKLLDTYQIHHRQGGLKRKLETSNEVQVGSPFIKIKRFHFHDKQS